MNLRGYQQRAYSKFAGLAITVLTEHTTRFVQRGHHLVDLVDLVVYGDLSLANIREMPGKY